MADVVGVVFQDGSKTYHFDSAGLDLARGDRVVVQTSKGAEIGQVVEPTHHVDDSELAASLKRVVRVATGADLEAQACSQCQRKEIMATCREMIATHGLDMKLVSADISFGGERVTFSFYSDERVDFRALVADLSKALKMRVELRQVGAREEARMVGGLGPCGRHLCCTLFPGDEDPVSIRMAKEQNLPLNPVKISGLCGRLMCCLKYEQEQYVSFRKEAPSRGTKVVTPAGDSVITGYNVPKDAIIVRLEDGSYADLRLEDCAVQEDGTYLFTPPAEEEPAQKTPEYRVPDFSLLPSDEEDMPAGAVAAAAARAAAVAAAGAGVGGVLGASGSGDGQARASENEGSGEPGTSRRSRSRRSRGRRGRGQASAMGAESGDAGTGDGKGGDGRGAASDQTRTSGGHQRGERGPRQHKERAKTDSPAQRSGQPGEGGSGEIGGGDQAAGGERRPRRRRRSRRSGGAGGAGGEGQGGNGSGNVSGGGGGGSGGSPGE